MHTKTIRCLFVVFAMYTSSVLAQCPAAISAATSVTAAGCPSSGSATISTTPVATASFLYTLTTGPAGALLNVPQSPNTFNALPAGAYTATVSCGAVQTVVSFTISDTYTPISNVKATASGNCGGFSQGGTVSVVATGGKAPLSYSIIKSTDPNYADALSVYNPSSTKTVSSFGTYQVRVRDACNQFYTTTIQVGSTLNPVNIHFYPHPLTSCSPTVYKFFYGVVYASSDAFIDFTPYEAAGGVKVNVYEKASGTCGPTGPVLLSFVSHGNWMDDTARIPVVSSNQYYTQAITACGDTTSDCFDASNVVNPDFSVAAIVTGCGTGGNPFLESIVTDNYGYGIIYPITVKIFAGTSAAGALVGTQTAATENDLDNLNFSGLTPATYFMQSTDACGHVNTQIIDNPAAAGAPALNFSYFATNDCTNAGITTQSGTATVLFSAGGVFTNLAGATATIISGPGSIGATSLQNSGNFVWVNLLPGNYIAAVTTSCGVTNIAFTVPTSSGNFLTQNIAASSTFTCGSGSGNVTATTDYNGGYSPSFVLVNATTHLGADSNATGSFANVPAGQYYVRLKLNNSAGCGGGPDVYYINSNVVNVTAPGAGPQINKQLGVICEDAGGNALSTGTAYLFITGGSPLLVEYKLTSSSSWIKWSANSPAETSISGLTAGSIYDIRVTSCGITAVTQVSISRAAPVQTSTVQQPCAGSPYELDLPQLPGATYEWKDAAGAVIATTYNFTIPVYNSSFDGKYYGTLTWSGCIRRTDTVTVNSNQCGSFLILPVKISSFNARAQNCSIVLSWSSAANEELKGFDIERSTNALEYTKIAAVMPRKLTDYTCTDNTSPQGPIYYRLRINDSQGHFQYSNTIVSNARCNSINTQWSVYPSLANPGIPVNIRLYTTNTLLSRAGLVVTSVTGQQVFANIFTVQPGENIYTLPGNNLVPGTYLVYIYDNKGQRVGEVQKIVYTR